MIELLLVAEKLISDGDFDRAELLFAQVSQADPRNAIAVAGLARVALARGDHEKAFDEARRALAIDPEEGAAQRLLDKLITEAEARDEGAGQDLDPVPPATWSVDPAVAEEARLQTAAEEARAQAEAATEARAQVWALAQAGATEARAQAIANARAAAAEARAEATAVAQAAVAQAAVASRQVTSEPASATPERRSLLARLLGLFGMRR